MNDNKLKSVRFDGTVTLGNLLTMIGMAATILALWRNVETRVVLVEERLTVQSKGLEKLVSTVERLAAAQAQINLYQEQRTMKGQP